MRKVIFILLALFVFQKWDMINGYLNISTTQSTESSELVLLYATRSYGYCAKTRQLLSNNNIDYIEYDIERSTEAARRFKSLGDSGVPLLVINGTVVKGYNRDRILDLTN